MSAALSGGVGGPDALRPLLELVLTGLQAGAEHRAGPIPAGRPAELAEQARAAFGSEPDEDALLRLTEFLAYGSADPADPACAAHLHCPPLAVAVAADLAVSALNPSLDSWDQAPVATALETALLAELAGLVGFDPGRAAGVLTSGGTESNLMGLMLARDQVLAADVELNGLPAGVRPRIIASRAAHFSVQRSAALLGLGEHAVRAVPVDRELRMDPGLLAETLAETVREGGTPIAVVATAGTTDTGAVDPLHRAADLAAEYGAWLHVDAAYGGGALLSERLAPLLDGIARADSVSLDWHKLGWQPRSSWSAARRRTPRSPAAPSTSTRRTTSARATRACSGCRCAPLGGPTPSSWPSPCGPSAGPGWADLSTPVTSSHSPPPGPSAPTPRWSCTAIRSSPPWCSATSPPPVTRWRRTGAMPSCAAPCCALAARWSAGPSCLATAPAGSGSS